MSEITFPAIQLKMNISSIAFKIFEIPIYWYAIFIIAAVIIGILLCKKDDGKYNIKFDDILSLYILLIPVSLVCARLYYIIFRLDYYLTNPLQILNIRDGGLAIYGGIIGGVITIYFYSKRKKLNFLDMLDYVAPYLALRSSNRQKRKLPKWLVII